MAISFCTTGTPDSGSSRRSWVIVGTASRATVPGSSGNETASPGLTASPHRGSGQPAASSVMEVTRQCVAVPPVASSIASTEV